MSRPGIAKRAAVKWTQARTRFLARPDPGLATAGRALVTSKVPMLFLLLRTTPLRRHRIITEILGMKHVRTAEANKSRNCVC